MSIILGIQKRLTEVGRIRMGEKQGNRPVKLDNFRITSPNQSILGEVAERYGGNITPWDDQYQVTIAENEINILLPMSDGIFSEWYEEWSRGGIQKRCTGEYDEVRDCPCDCVPGDRMCKPTSRLSMWLPEIESLGVWMLSSTGYNANAELGGTVQALQDAARALGRPVKATLSLEQRKKVSEGQTRRFAVPVIQPREPVERILEATQGTQQRLQAADRPDIPAIAPPPDDFADEPAYLQVDNPQQPFTRNPEAVDMTATNEKLYALIDTWDAEDRQEKISKTNKGILEVEISRAMNELGAELFKAEDGSITVTAKEKVIYDDNTLGMLGEIFSPEDMEGLLVKPRPRRFNHTKIKNLRKAGGKAKQIIDSAMKVLPDKVLTIKRKV